MMMIAFVAVAPTFWIFHEVSPDRDQLHAFTDVEEPHPQPQRTQLDICPRCQYSYFSTFPLKNHLNVLFDYDCASDHET